MPIRNKNKKWRFSGILQCFMYNIASKKKINTEFFNFDFFP